MHEKRGPETSHEERAHHHMEVVYARKLEERRTFMEDLKAYRTKRDKKRFEAVKNSVGPRWYQALSVQQRKALDSLKFCIHQDLLEGRPIKTAFIMSRLGIVPSPNTNDLMNCLYLSQEDPKEMLAQLFLVHYGLPFEFKQPRYDLNGKLILSGILYLGLDNLIVLLKELFKPDKVEVQPKKKVKPKPKEPLKSPYLEKFKVPLYYPQRPKPTPPAPLPDLTELNEQVIEPVVLAPKPPPPPPPPPPPKKRLPRSYCDKLAGIMDIGLTALPAPVSQTKPLVRKQKSKGGLRVTEVKKAYGISMTTSKPKKRMRKPHIPQTGLMNQQYHIIGVYKHHGKQYTVLGNITILPAQGELIHGGHCRVNNAYVNLHLGYRAYPSPPQQDPCDCLKKYQKRIMEYLKGSKCKCGHHYDYYNEGTFPPEDVPFFVKATKHTPHYFNYDTIYDTDAKRLHVDKEFKRIWETESMLMSKENRNKIDTTKKKKKSSSTCLGDHPRPTDYLRCALAAMRKVNTAARLPDAHLVPELKEWMRYRIYGRYTDSQRKAILHRSTNNWQLLLTLAVHGYGHVSPPKVVMFNKPTNWSKKQYLNEKFQIFAQSYRLKLFRSHAQFTNLLWATMGQAQFPDKTFRETFFSYLFARCQDLMLMHPFNRVEVAERTRLVTSKRLICIPEGIEPNQ